MKKLPFIFFVLVFISHKITSQVSNSKTICFIEIFMVDPYASNGAYRFTQKTIEPIVREGLKDTENKSDYFMKKIESGKEYKLLKNYINYNGIKCKEQPLLSKTGISLLIKYTYSDSTNYLLGISDYYSQKIVDGTNNIIYQCNPELMRIIKKMTTNRFDKRTKNKKPILQKCDC